MISQKKRVEILEKALIDSAAEFAAVGRLLAVMCEKLNQACSATSFMSSLHTILESCPQLNESFVKMVSADPTFVPMVIAKMARIRKCVGPDMPDSPGSAAPIHFIKAMMIREKQFQYIFENLPDLKERIEHGQLFEAEMYQKLASSEDNRREAAEWVLAEAKIMLKQRAESGSTADPDSVAESEFIKTLTKHWQPKKEEADDEAGHE